MTSIEMVMESLVNNLTIMENVLINKIEKRTEFAIVIAIFFSTILSLFMSKNDFDKPDLELIYGSVAAIYLLVYILIQIGNKYLTEGWFKVINSSLLIGIMSFAYPLLVLTSNAEEIGWAGQVLLKVSFFGIVSLPLAIVFLIVIGFVIESFRSKN